MVLLSTAKVTNLGQQQKNHARWKNALMACGDLLQTKWKSNRGDCVRHRTANAASVLIAKFAPSPPHDKTNFAIRTLAN
jgi:hypothetical protein